MNTKYFLPFVGIIGIFVVLFIVALLPKAEPHEFSPPPKEWMKDTVFTEPYVSEDKPDSLQWRVEPMEDEPDNY